MLKVKNLKKKYAKNIALNDISFEISDHGVYGLLGPNGAGKSTTMNIITGCLSPDEGSVEICGYDIFEEPVKAKSKIGYLPENPPLYSDMSVYGYLYFVAKAKKIPSATIEDDIKYLMERTALTKVSDKLISNLSKGYKQRVGIAQAMLGSPEIIILDEPTVGLDPKQIIEIRNLISELGKDHTVIFSSHILSEVQELCGELIVISEGKIVANDTIENLCNIGEEHPTLRLTVKCEPFDAMDICDEFEAITHYAITDGNVGTDLVLTLAKESDIREALFWAFSQRGIAILNMSYEKQSFEETYIKLTTPEYHEADEGEKTEEVIDESAASDEDDYKPMFTTEDNDDSAL